MKPKLTTDGTALIRQVRAELTEPFSEACALLFAVQPALGTGHCSIQFIEEENPFLITREWKPHLQGVYPAGIYDLNDIYVAEKRIALSEENCAFIRGIKNLDPGIERSNAIMLDGADYSLQIGEKRIHWRLIDAISPELESALKKLGDLAGFILK